MNPSLCASAKAGLGSAEVELAKMVRLALHQGHGLLSHYEVGGFEYIFFGGVISLKYPFPFILDNDR